MMRAIPLFPLVVLVFSTTVLVLTNVFLYLKSRSKRDYD